MSTVKLQKGSVFERHELKYLLNSTQHKTLLQQLHAKMQADQYGRHTICTLYYDTQDFAVIRRCLDKPRFREKLRLRSYGVPTPGSQVYLELKKKMNGITYKRREPMQLREAREYLDEGISPLQKSQILCEIDWYIRQQALQGQVVLCYDRLALFGREDPQFRVTFDSNIRWRNYNTALDAGDHGALLLAPGTHLMEIKTMNALPCWLVQMLSELYIYPTSFSKYGMVYQKYIAGKGGTVPCGVVS